MTAFTSADNTDVHCVIVEYYCKNGIVDVDTSNVNRFKVKHGDKTDYVRKKETTSARK